MAPFQARMDYLIKERKKYQKLLDELKRAKISNENSKKKTSGAKNSKAKGKQTKITNFTKNSGENKENVAVDEE